MERKSFFLPKALVGTPRRPNLCARAISAASDDWAAVRNIQIEQNSVRAGMLGCGGQDFGDVEGIPHLNSAS